MIRSSRKHLVLAVAALCALSFFAPSKSFANEQNWAYVQSVGGMRLGEPKQTSVEWILPVEIDITGQHNITVKPTVTNSGLTCEGIGAEFHGQKVYLALFTGMPWIGSGRGQCPPISLGHPAPGTYTVYYKGAGEDAVKLGEISITP